MWNLKKKKERKMLGFPGGSAVESAYNAGEAGLSPGLERSPREGNDNQYPAWEML